MIRLLVPAVVSVVMAAGCAGSASDEQSSSTTAEPAEQAETEPTPTSETVPPRPALEDAPWDTEAVPPPADLAATAQAWADSGFPDCQLYSPTAISSNLGYTDLGPAFTRFGSLDIFWGNTTDSVGVGIWPADNTSVGYYLDREPDVQYSDGSELRRDPDAGRQQALISIPGQSCFYEVHATNLAAWGTVLDSLRPIEVRTAAPPSTATASPNPGDPCDLGALADCIDPDGDGQGTYLLEGASCMATPGVTSPGLCTDLDGDGLAGYPDAG